MQGFFPARGELRNSPASRRLAPNTETEPTPAHKTAWRYQAAQLGRKLPIGECVTDLRIVGKFHNKFSFIIPLLLKARWLA